MSGGGSGRGKAGMGKVLRMFDQKAYFEAPQSAQGLQASRGSSDGSTATFSTYNLNGGLPLDYLPASSPPTQIIPFEAIFGIYDLLSGQYVALVVESEPYVTLSNFSLRKVKKILIIPLFRNGKVLSESKQRDENRYLQLLHSAFSEHHFFFSWQHHITQTQQRIAKMELNGSASSSSSLWANADPRFCWNAQLVNQLVDCQASDWLVPFMSAYVEHRLDLEIEQNKFTMLFITRRSRLRQGCRFTKRGIDDNGNVANFAETEQILMFPDGKLTSFVQVRGSIPLLWSSPVCMKYEPAVYIDNERIKDSIDFATKHTDLLCELYSDNSNPRKSGVTFVNLIDKKKDQQRLGLAFHEVFTQVQKKNSYQAANKSALNYHWFDFHAECKKKGGWNNLYALMEQTDTFLQAHEWFCRMPDGKVTKWQVGVVRTNCMDNLDRTNVVQSLYARRSIMLQLGKKVEIGPKTALDSEFKSFEKVFKAVWANNADAVSMGYAGTPALKTDFTRTGKNTTKGKINDGIYSAVRYYKNNLTDGVKQDSIDLLVGNYRPDVTSTAASPFAPRPGQETLASNLTKAFVLMIVVFSALMLLSPSFHDSATLTTHLLISCAVTFLVFLFILYRVVKKGSTIGERIVNHPCLLPESRQR